MTNLSLKKFPTWYRTLSQENVLKPLGSSSLISNPCASMLSIIFCLLFRLVRHRLFVVVVVVFCRDHQHPDPIPTGPSVASRRRKDLPKSDRRQALSSTGKAKKDKKSFQKIILFKNSLELFKIKLSNVKKPHVGPKGQGMAASMLNLLLSNFDNSSLFVIRLGYELFVIFNILFFDVLTVTQSILNNSSKQNVVMLLIDSNVNVCLSLSGYITVGQMWAWGRGRYLIDNFSNILKDLNDTYT